MTNLLINLSLFEHAARLLKKDFPSSSDAKQSPVEDLRERCCGFCWAVSPDERFSSAVLLSGLCGQQRVEVSSYSWETSLAVSLSLRPVSSSSRFHLFLLSVPPFFPAASWPCLGRRLQHSDLFSECFKSFHSDLECDIVHILPVGCGTNSWIIKSRAWSSETEKHERDAGLRKTATALVGEESHSQGSFLSVNGSFLLPQYVLIVCITGVPSVGTLLFLPDTQRLSGNRGGGWYQDISSPSLKTTNVSLCFSGLEELSRREHLRGHIKIMGSSRWSPHVEIKSSF